MPFLLVITKEGGSDAVTAVPNGWVDNDILYWPKTSKKAEIESLRTDENSIPESNWRKQKCKVKLRDIATFFEALRLEEMYSKFEDTADEEAYFKKVQQKKKHPTHKYVEAIDLNAQFESIDTSQLKNLEPETSNFNNYIVSSGLEDVGDKTYKANDLCENVTILLSTSAEDKLQNENIPFVDAESVAHIFHDQCKDVTNQNFVIKEQPFLELLKIMDSISDQNKTLLEKNSKLKEEIKNLNKEKMDIDRRYNIIQVKLDKILEHVMKTKDPEREAVDENDNLIVGNLNFPIESIEDLDLLESNLIDKNVETSLVKKFSNICGKGGSLKLAKVGLMITKHIIKDEFLQQCTWKGIKGCNKTPFMQYTKTRELLYKIIKLADRSCTASEVDSFIQCSAIKHSGQRLKRKNGDNEKVNITEKKQRTSSKKSPQEKPLTIADNNNDIETDNIEILQSSEISLDKKELQETEDNIKENTGNLKIMKS